MDDRRLPPGHFLLLFFAASRTCAGREKDILPAPMTMAALRKHLGQQYPGMEAILEASALTINLEYVDEDEGSEVVIKGGDEVAIIPPVSSG